MHHLDDLQRGQRNVRADDEEAEGVPVALDVEGVRHVGRRRHRHRLRRRRAAAGLQGLTLDRFSAQPKPFVTQEHTLTTPYYPLTPPKHPLNTP